MQRKTHTIVLIHGLWMSPRCWDQFRALYEAHGYRVLAPAWPCMHGEVEEIRREPNALANVGLAEVAAHYEAIVRELPEPPILIGHSMGGLIVQILLNRGLGVAGVAIDSATPAGIYRLPWSVIKSGLPALGNPLNFRRAVSLTFEQFRYAFANAMSEGDARTAYERYAVPGPARPVFEVAASNFNPWAPNRVNFAANRAPLLIVGGEKDHLVPAVLNRTNARLYRRSPALTEYREFPGRCHLLIAQEGWEQIAEFALHWAEEAIDYAAADSQAREPLALN